MKQEKIVNLVSILDIVLSVVMAIFEFFFSAINLIIIVLAIIFAVWGYGAFSAYHDIDTNQSIGIVLQRMYGTEYNPLTRHGYRMFIKHFTTMDPNGEIDEKNIINALNETGSDLEAFLNKKNDSEGDKFFHRLRESLADAAGNAARQQNNFSSILGKNVGEVFFETLITEALLNTSESDQPDDNLSSEENAENTEKQFQTGIRYLEGDGVEKDSSKAVKWFRVAADHGDVRAQYLLGVCYCVGEGVEEDIVEAVKWYHIAANQGFMIAQYELANCYNNGDGIEENKAEAVKWYHLAANQGSADAQYKLGNCYANGEGVEEDKAEATKWYRMAASQENAKAQFVLGMYYESGLGVEKNTETAKQWYKRAAKQGHREAMVRLKEDDDQ